MLTHTHERGQLKCDRYFPLSSEQELQAGPFLVRVAAKSERRRMCRATPLQLENTLDGRTRLVAHVAYLNWPDKGVPSSVDTFRKFANYLRLVNVNVARRNGFDLSAGAAVRGPPIVVHCSAGIGETRREGVLVRLVATPSHSEAAPESS